MGSDGLCPGPCNSHFRDARTAYEQAHVLYDPLDPSQSRPEPPSGGTSGEPVWCPRCASRVAECLPELDDAAALLRATADGYRPNDLESSRVGGSRDTTSPSPSADDVEELATVLLGHERAYRNERGWPSAAPRTGERELAGIITVVSAWLRSHLDGILRTEADGLAERFGLDVLRFHAMFTAKAKAGTRKLRKPLRCPSCRLLTLVWEDSRPDDVKCGNPDCRAVMSYSQYEASVTRAAGAA